MTLSQSSEINLTDNGKRALNAQNTANNAYNLANGAQDLANGAQKTADGKNSVYRGTDPSTVPKTGLKEGDIYFTDNALYTWNGSAWEETVSDTTGAEIHAKVEAAMQESQKADADLRSNIESKAKELDASIQSTKTDMTAATNAVASDLSATKSNLDAVSKDLSTTKSNMQSGLDSVNKDLSTTKSNLDAVSKDLSDTKSSTQSSLDAINKDLSTTKSNLGTVSNDLSETKSNLATVASDLSTTKSNLGTVSNDLSETKNNLATVTDDLSKTKSSMQSGLDAVNNSLSETKNDLVNVSKDLSDTKSSTQSSLDAINEDLSTAKSDLASVSKDLSDTKSNLGTVSNDLSETKNNLATVTDDLSTAKSDLADTGNRLDTAVSDFQKKTDQLSGSLETANSKIEFNSNAISEVKHTADGISTTVSSGGRNLIPQAGNFSTDYWAIASGGNGQGFFAKLDVTLPDSLKSDNILTILGNTQGNRDWVTTTYDVNVVKGQTYTFSVYVKLNANTGVADPMIQFRMWGKNTNHQTWGVAQNGLGLSKTAWKRVSFTAVASDSDFSRPAFGIVGQGSIDFAFPQFEVGGMATPWQPSGNDISTLRQTADAIRADLTNTNGDVASLKVTANSLTSDIADAKGSISQLQQTASGLQSTVSQLPAQWQQAINDKTTAQVLSSGVDMNNLTTAGTYLIKDFNVKNAPISAWFMATVEATADKSRVVQRVKKDSANVAYERSNMDTGWTAWERVATGTDISSIQQTINGITTKVGDAESNVSTLQQTAKDITSRVGSAEGNISQLQQDSKGLTSRVGSAEGSISQLKQTASGLTSTVSNMKVGGRNLLGGDTKSEHTASYPTSGNIDMVNITMLIPANQTQYTLSFDAKSTHTGDNITCYLYNSISGGHNSVTGGENSQGVKNQYNDGNMPFTLTNSYQRYWVKWTNTQNDGKLTVLCGRLNAGAGSGSVSIKNIKLEVGNTPTDWTPAPETFDESISQLQQTADKIQAQVDDNKGNISSVTQTVNAVKTDLADAKGDISSLQQTANGLTTRVGDAEGNISTLQQTSKGLESRVGSAEGNISSLQQTSTQLTSDMQDAKGDVSSLQQTARGLTSRVEGAEGNISSLQQTSKDLTSRIGSAEGNVSTLQQTSKDLTARVGSAEGNISQLQLTANGLTSTVSNLKSGGANMLPAGKLFPRNSSTVTYDAGADTYTVVNPASLDAYWGSGVALPNACIEIPWGQTACISMQVYTPTAGTIAVDINNSGDGVTAGNDNDNRNNATFHNMNVPANEWTTVWFTYENSSLTRNPNKVSLWDSKSGIGLNVANVTWKIRHPMVQLGTFPSEWSPSPKDTDSAISQIKQTADKIQAQVDDNKGNISSVTQTANAVKTDLANTKGDVSSLQQTANKLTSDMADAEGNISSLQQTATGLQSDLSDAKGDISSLQQTTNGLTSRVGSAEGNISTLQQTASGLTSTVSNMHAGDRNYVRGTSNDWINLTDFDNKTNWCLQIGTFYINDLQVGDKVGFGITFKNTGITSGNMRVQGNGDVSGWNFVVGLNDSITNIVETGATATLWKLHIITDDDVKNNKINLQVRTDNVPAGGTLSAKCVYIKRGTLATDWTPAPEDVDSSISQISQTAEAIRADLTNTQGDVASVQATANNLTSSIANAKGDISSLQQTANGLTTRVGSAEGNISQLQQTANGLTSRVGGAEGNISQLQQTADSLTSTLSNGGVNLLNGTSDTEITNTYPTSGSSDKKYYGMSVPANQTDYVLSFDAKATVAGDKILCYMFAPNQVKKGVSSQNATTFSVDGAMQFSLTTDWVRYWVHYTITPTSKLPTIIVGRTVPGGSGTISFKCVQLECGSTPTPWSPSTGDISQLQQTASQLTSDMKDAKGNISSFQQTAGGLTSRVGSAESNISQLQQDSKGLTSRVGSAESNISQLQQTASGLTSTVSNMKSGGANMLPAGKLTSYNSSSVTYDASTDTYTIVNPASADPSWGSGVTLPNACIEIPWGQTACISMEVYTPTAETIVVDINNSGDGVTAGNDNDNRDKATFHNMDVSANEWTTIWFTYENSDPNRNPNKVSLWDAQSGIGLKLNSVTWKVRHPVVQLGTFPSGWSPSPKDTDSAVSQIKQTADGITAYVKESKGSQTLSSLLSMDPNNSTIAQVVNGKPVAAINLSSEGDVAIDGKKLHITASTTIDDATIKSSMIESLEATKIKAGTLDASKIQVINLDANSITTGSFSAVLGKQLNFKTYTVSPSSIWDFNYTKSNYDNWFLNGETTADHIYNGPKDTNNNKLTPYMYVSSRGVGDSYVVTVWRDYDPTQYQRVWIHDHWTDWVMLPNSQNIVSVINLSPDGVTINGKNIELNGDTTITGQLNLLPKDQQTVSLFGQGLYNPWAWKDSKVFAGTGGIQLQSTVTGQQYSNDYTSVSGLVNGSSPAITTLAPTYLKFTLYKSWGDFNNNYSNQLARTYIDAGRIETNDVFAGGIRLFDSKIRGLYGSVYVTNFNGTNFDNAGGVGFQVWGGIGLGQSTIYTPGTDLYVQQGNVGPALGQSYSSSAKTEIHCKTVTTQVANTVTSQLSVKTAITKVDYDRALMAIQNTDMYDYRYTSDESNQHYVSGIIDDIHDKPEYNMDPMLINQERTARIDANLLGYHHVVLQDILKRLDKLEAKVNQD